jgi:3-deoxy-D-manno-octulosonate 8-phosphate phosphatase (KDO 8-P phosphatase)
MPEKDIAQLARNVEVLLMDVDGVLTNGQLLYVPLADENVVEVKSFAVTDGAAIVWAKRAGIKTGIISGLSSPAVSRRAERLGIDFVYEGLGQKKRTAYEDVLAKTRIPAERVCYVGDDLQDLPILTRVGFSVGVANAHPEVLARVAYVTRASGGNGAIRELVELILKAQGKWDPIMAEFLV